MHLLIIYALTLCIYAFPLCIYVPPARFVNVFTFSNLNYSRAFGAEIFVVQCRPVSSRRHGRHPEPKV